MTIRRRLAELNLDTSKQYILVDGNLVPKFSNSQEVIEEDEIKLPLKSAFFSLSTADIANVNVLKEKEQASVNETPVEPVESVNQETDSLVVSSAAESVEVVTAKVSTLTEEVLVEEKQQKNNFFKKKKQ
ncbi:MAG: hypothetical protein NTW30_04855 [Candidatus Aenigmarchaeota archaeon]|nr:hypothetical protein [Candidatus Aenigmarchaeota archaeon]